MLASSCTNQCQHYYYTLEILLPLGNLELNALSHPRTYQEDYVFPAATFYSPSFVNLSAITCYRSIQTSGSSGTVLDAGFMDSHCFQHVGRHYSLVSCHERFHEKCLIRPGAQGFARSNKVISLWNRTLVAFVDKLSSTTVDFIRSEEELKNCCIWVLRGSKRFYEHAQNLLDVKKGVGKIRTWEAKVHRFFVYVFKRYILDPLPTNKKNADFLSMFSKGTCWTPQMRKMQIFLSMFSKDIYIYIYVGPPQIRKMQTF